MPPRWTHAKYKRRASEALPHGSLTEIELTTFRSTITSIHFAPECVFHADEADSKLNLARECWTTNACILNATSLQSHNPELASFLEVLCRNKKSSTSRISNDDGGRSSFRASQIENLLANLTRMASQKNMPVLTARFSMAAYRAQLPYDFWDMLHLLAPGILASRRWTESVLEIAERVRPPPADEPLSGVGAVMFDNYTRRVLYSSMVTVDSQGYLLHMTNSCSMVVPKKLATPNFDALSLFREPFVQQKSLSAFVAKFMIGNLEIRNRKRTRFTRFLRRATNGSLFQRPSSKPDWVAHMTYHPPMFNLLQSSYEDVEAELNVLRNRHTDKLFLLVGGDGLSIMRILHLLAKHPDLYQDSAPFIIPVQGESPHGVYHVMHAGWRLYSKFIRVCADELENPQIVDDPSVKQFNSSLYFLWRVLRAASEYLVHLSRSAGAVDIDMPDEFIQECEFNVDLAWVVHFVYDFGFLVLDFKQEVRKGSASNLDLLWREFFALGRTSSANKTNYGPMAIMRIFFSDALKPELAQLCARMRSIPMSDSEGSMIGWDCVIEWLNAAISEGVVHRVSEERIERFIRFYPMLRHNHHVLREEMLSSQERLAAWMKDSESDVARLKSLFMNKVGHDWSTATRANSDSRLGIKRGKVPWEEVQETMARRGEDSVGAYVSRHLNTLTSSYYVWSP